MSTVKNLNFKKKISTKSQSKKSKSVIAIDESYMSETTDVGRNGNINLIIPPVKSIIVNKNISNSSSSNSLKSETSIDPEELEDIFDNSCPIVSENSRPIVSENSSSVSSTVVVNNGNQLKKWFFTFNNYEEKDIEQMISCFNKICSKYIFQEELGNKCGTPHLQGNIWLFKKMRWSEFKLNKKICWQPTRNEEAAISYCSKISTRNGRQWSKGFEELNKNKLPEDYYDFKGVIETISVLRPWQKTVFESMKKKPDGRTINWIYDKNGNCGKSAFKCYCIDNYKANFITTDRGSINDIANIFYNCFFNDDIKNKLDPTLLGTFVLDLARANEHFISYNAIEKILDGCMTNTKYVCKNMRFQKPHVWVFANCLPDYSQCSKDRWKVFSIDNNFELIPYVKPIEKKIKKKSFVWFKKSSIDSDNELSPNLELD